MCVAVCVCVCVYVCVCVCVWCVCEWDRIFTQHHDAFILLLTITKYVYNFHIHAAYRLYILYGNTISLLYPKKHIY